MNRIFHPFKTIRKKAKTDRMTPTDNRRRVGRTLFYISLLALLSFILRLTWLIATNNVNGVNLAEAAQANYMANVIVPAQRGTIYDRTGVALAQDSLTYQLYITLDKNVVDTNGNKMYAPQSEFPKLVDFLYKELAIPKSLAQSQLNSVNDGKYQVLMGTNGNNISSTKMAQIQADAKKEGLTGIGFTASVTRSYPNGNFASNLIGVATPQNSGNSTTIVGVNGIEASYNNILTGKNGSQVLYKDQYNHPIPGDIKSQVLAQNGQDIYTTLDYSLQHSAETLLDAAYSATGAQQVSINLLDAHTGELLATAQRPTFNPQTGKQVIGSQTSSQYDTSYSLLYQSQYEPGSTMKTFLVSAAINSGNFDANKTYTRAVNLSSLGITINDWDVNENNGNYILPQTVTAAEGFYMSSNTVMSQIEMGMGNATWDSYLNAFKFGVPTRFGLGNEAFGSLPPANLANQITSAFGQGVDVTEIQMLRGWTAIANGGTMLEPHVVSKIVNPNNSTVLQSEPEVIGQPITASTSSQVLGLMLGVDTNTTYGTANKGIFKYYEETGQSGPFFEVNGQAAAVKTGTAQIPSPTGGYLSGTNETLNSYVVMYPASNPDFIAYMTVLIPSKDTTPVPAANVINPLLTQAEALKGEIAATETNLKAGTVKLSDYKQSDPGTTAADLRRTLLDPVVIGQGSKVTDQSISAGTEVGANTRVLLLTSGSAVMPDMTDWSKSDVETLAKWYNLKVTYKGKGAVTNQSISGGTNLKKDQHITVTLG